MINDKKEWYIIIMTNYIDNILYININYYNYKTINK